MENGKLKNLHGGPMYAEDINRIISNIESINEKINEITSNLQNQINNLKTGSISGSSGNTANIVDSIDKGDARKDAVPNPFAVNSFVMSLMPVDIVSDKEFDTGKTLDGKKIYGYYAKTYPFVDENISQYQWIATIPFGSSYNVDSSNNLQTIRLPMQCISEDANQGVYYIEFGGFEIDEANMNYVSKKVEMRVLPVICSMPSSWFNGFIFYTKE